MEVWLTGLEVAGYSGTLVGDGMGALAGMRRGVHGGGGGGGRVGEQKEEAL